MPPRPICTSTPAAARSLENIAEAGGILPLMMARGQDPPVRLSRLWSGRGSGTGQVSLRTFPATSRPLRHQGRPGPPAPRDGGGYALTARITDPRELGKEMAYPQVAEAKERIADRRPAVCPSEELRLTEVVRGPNIKVFPEFDPCPKILQPTVAIKVGDNISTDGIMPAGRCCRYARTSKRSATCFLSTGSGGFMPAAASWAMWL
ncbi:MAG: hypothetical protein R2864_05330 [Syntrophotaleaceae bacterium]